MVLDTKCKTCGQSLYGNDAYKEIERLQNWVNDCQSGMYINCVYCGYRYGPSSGPDEVPATMADVLKEHIEICPEHPMSFMKRLLDKNLLFISTLTDLGIINLIVVPEIIKAAKKIGESNLESDMRALLVKAGIKF